RVLRVRNPGDRAELVPFEVAHVSGRQYLDDVRERLHTLREPIDPLEGFSREQPVGVQRDDDPLVGAESRVERAERIEVAAPRRDHGLDPGIDPQRERAPSQDHGQQRDQRQRQSASSQEAWDQAEGLTGFGHPAYSGTATRSMWSITASLFLIAPSRALYGL